MRWIALIPCFLVGMLLGAQEQPPVPFTCDCALGSSATVYHVRVSQQYGPGVATIAFAKSNARLSRYSASFPGTLVEFQLNGTDLVFTLVYPGPHTVVFSENNGKIEKELDCSSAFTAIFTWKHAVCFSGKQGLDNGSQVPESAIIYDRTAHPYKHVSTVPFVSMYQELFKLGDK